MDSEAAVIMGVMGVLVAVLGFFILGVCGLVAAGLVMVVVFGYIAGGGESRLPQAPFRYACPSCGGDAYSNQSVCPDCGQALPAVQASVGTAAARFCPTCGARYPGDYNVCPKEGTELKALP